MSDEKPLVTWAEIAAHLKVCEEVAKETIKKKRIPIFYIGNRVAIYPSTLKKCLESS